MDANAYRMGRAENEGSVIIVLKDDPLTRLGIVFPQTCMALRGARIIQMTPRICRLRMHAHVTHTSPTRLVDTSKIAN